MGDRVSISFVNGNDESVTLFSHWQGKDFVKRAKAYVKTISPFNGNDPLGRGEPNTVMVDFIRHITKNESQIRSDLYLGKDENEGDNSDNGHFKIKLA